MHSLHPTMARGRANANKFAEATHASVVSRDPGLVTLGWPSRPANLGSVAVWRFALHETETAP